MTHFLSRIAARTSIATLVAISSVLLTAALVGHDVVVSRQQLSEEGIRYGQFVTETIRSSAQRAVHQGSIVPLQETIEAAGRSGLVPHLALVDGDGRIIAGDRSDWTGRAQRILGETENRELAVPALGSRQPRHSLADGGRRLVLASPLWLGGPSATRPEGDHALLYIEIDLDGRRRDHWIAVLKRGSISALASLGLSLFVVLSMRAIIERRIRGVSRDARAAARGEAVPPRRVGWPREMAWLIQDVGRLGSDLRDKVSALQAAKDQLVEAQRTAGVADRAHAMAHDLNNQLTGILGYARLLLDRVGPGDPILRQLAIIETCATRAADLTGGLLTFGPPDPADASRPPRIDPAAAGAPSARVEGAARESRVGAARPATILAVDDESTVLALAKDVLEMHGHNVLTARNGEEALRVFRARRGEIDLVLLDLMMPVMGGQECFRELRRIDPGVRVVVSSGFSSESSASEVLGEGALGYLQKPYDIDLLARTVIGALNRPMPATAARAAG